MCKGRAVDSGVGGVDSVEGTQSDSTEEGSMFQQEPIIESIPDT